MLLSNCSLLITVSLFVTTGFKKLKDKIVKNTQNNMLKTSLKQAISLLNHFFVISKPNSDRLIILSCF
jgi:hypothetical protein